MDLNELVQSIRHTNDYERRIHGAIRIHYNPRMDKWRNDVLHDKYNNNFFLLLAPIIVKDVLDAVALQKSENHGGMMLRGFAPLEQEVSASFAFETEKTDVMALLENNSAAWKVNPDIVIRDIQNEDISRDMLDVSTTPPEYRAAALRSMKQALKAAKAHPEYHWLIAYKGDKAVGGCYALCKNGVIEMDDLEVHADHRGQYIATTLMRYIAQNFAGTMYLHAVDGESVHDMYEKMGFVTVDTLYDYYLEW